MGVEQLNTVGLSLEKPLKRKKAQVGKNPSPFLIAKAASFIANTRQANVYVKAKGYIFIIHPGSTLTLHRIDNGEERTVDLADITSATWDWFKVEEITPENAES